MGGYYRYSFDHLYERNFKLLVFVQIILALGLPLIPQITIPFLIISYFLIALRFRGNFNGGSDAMTMATLLSLLLIFIFPSKGLINSIGFYLLNDVHLLTIQTWVVLATSYVVLSHSIPNFHSKHHNVFVRNFGTLGIMDWIFKTYM